MCVDCVSSPVEGSSDLMLFKNVIYEFPVVFLAQIFFIKISQMGLCFIYLFLAYC